jgi:protein TonB
MEGKKRWRTAVAGSLLLHVVLFAAVGSFWTWESTKSKEPIYIEVSMAELFSPVDGEAGGGGSAAGAPSAATPQHNQVSPQSNNGFSEVTNLQQATSVPGTATASGSGGAGGTGGAGGGIGGGNGPGRGTGVGPGTGTSSGSTVVQADLSGIIDAFVQRLEERKEYPYIARRRGQTGTVTVRVVLSANGSLESVSVISSSGVERLDEAAVMLVHAACPYRHGIGRELRMTIPIAYDLKG